MVEDCLFCKIARGDIPSEKVYEDNSVIAFLDIFPAAKGHTLIIPKNHFDTLNNTPDDILARMVVVAKKVSRAVTSAFNADGVNLFQNNGEAAGQVIHHVHLHVVPRMADDGLGFKIKQKGYDGDEIKNIRRQITDHWDTD